MKRIIVISILTVITIVSLVGCGNKSEEDMTGKNGEVVILHDIEGEGESSNDTPPSQEEIIENKLIFDNDSAIVDKEGTTFSGDYWSDYAQSNTVNIKISGFTGTVKEAEWSLWDSQLYYGGRLYLVSNEGDLYVQTATDIDPIDSEEKIPTQLIVTKVESSKKIDDIGYLASIALDEDGKTVEDLETDFEIVKYQDGTYGFYNKESNTIEDMNLEAYYNSVLTNPETNFLLQEEE